MRFERHDPVDGKKGDSKTVKHQSRAAHAFETDGEPRIARAVLFVGPAVQSARESPPNSEINDVANEEEWQVQIELLGFENRIRGDEILMCPGIQPAQAQEKWKNQNREHRQGARASLQWTANRQAPKATGQVMNHEKRGATQWEAEPENVRKQVRAEKLLGCAYTVDHRQSEQRDSQNEGAVLDAVESSGEWLGRRHCDCPVSVGRSDSGTSAAEPLWLNCNARM